MPEVFCREVFQVSLIVQQFLNSRTTKLVEFELFHFFFNHMTFIVTAAKG